MKTISNFKRFTPITPIDCCNTKKGIWVYNVFDFESCRCGFRLGCDRYIYCELCRTLYFTYADTPQTLIRSSHNYCNCNVMSDHRKEFLIDEARYMYDKLRIIESILTKDVIRYITLGDLSTI